MYLEKVKRERGRGRAEMRKQDRIITLDLPTLLSFVGKGKEVQDLTTTQPRAKHVTARFALPCALR